MHTEIVQLNPISAHKCCPNTELICPEHQPYPEWSHQPLILQRYKLSMCRYAAAAALLPSHLQHCSMLMPHYKQYKHTMLCNLTAEHQEYNSYCCSSYIDCNYIYCSTVWVQYLLLQVAAGVPLRPGGLALVAALQRVLGQTFQRPPPQPGYYGG